MSQGRRAVRGQGHRAVPVISLMHLGVVGTSTHQVPHPEEGCRHFVPPSLLQGRAVAELLVADCFPVTCWELRAGYQGSPAALWVLQVGSQASCPLLLPKFVKVSGFQPEVGIG